ncbi:MAG: TIGR02921 family PEP-CTERM protein [Anaerolineae bacterium]|nr:MAG: TIGR02921 family PEP-CTERM protein [Anaerolineae bacterium]
MNERSSWAGARPAHTNLLRKLASPRGWAYGLFWSWNIIFLAFMFLGFAPQVLPEMIRAVRTETIPAAFLAYAAILTAIPVVAVILGLTLLRRSPRLLLLLGYGVEGPLMLMVGIRFFVVRQMTPAVLLLLSVAGLGMAALLWQILDRNIGVRGSLLAHLRAIGLTLLLLVGLYAAVWIAFYAPPVAVFGWEFIADLVRQVPEWRWVLLWILGTILAAYTGTLFVAMPIVVPILYVRAWWRGERALVANYGRLRAILLTMAVLVVCGVLFVLTNRQPQHVAFALLETPPATLAEAQALLGQRDKIRDGLLNAYLAPVRYFSAVGEVRHVREMYEYALNMSPKQARRVQQLYEAVARPLLYVPVSAPEAGGGVDNRVLQQEPFEAARLYETFFDRSIVEGERETIVHAVRSTWSVDQARTAWMAVDDREIHLVQQEVTVAEHGDWAEVELYEVYQNQTPQRQEVVYYFSLPESAVITGLWLGNSPDRDARFRYRVSPRGAAQAAYRNEVRRRVDPALVEQIGPRQYRLRIFPIQPQSWRRDGESGRSLEEGPPLYMWLTWRVLANGSVWPLPRLAEKRNVYWDETSARLVNGRPMDADEETWLPAYVHTSSSVTPVAHRVDLPAGLSLLARPVPVSGRPEAAADLRLAVVLDRSRSMVEVAVDVKTALTRLAEAAASGTMVDVYLAASKYRGETPSRVSLAELDPDGIVYYGGQNAAELLAQFAQLHADQDYDAIFVLTDDTGYELGAGGVEVPVPDAPVWMVHLGDNFPLGYDDATLQAIQASGGGVAGDVEEALVRLVLASEAEGGAASRDVIDGYVWSLVPTDVAQAETDEAVAVHAASDGFATFAARRFILAEMHRQRGALDRLGTLDHLHAIAIEHGIVTPYSSMIVLVNERQERLLDQLEERDDRFQREYEGIGETVGQSAFSVTGVPEPEEWLLLALAAAMLVWYARTARRTPRHQRSG